MATVKRGNVPPTHPTVWVGLALAVVGLLLAVYAYTGARVYDVVYVAVAVGGALLALFGIMLAAWGRSLMAARASRARRAAFSADAMSISDPAEQGSREAEEPPTVAAPASRSRFRFPSPRRAKDEAGKEDARERVAGLFAFGRRGEGEAPPEPAVEPAPVVAPVPEPGPAPEPAPVPVRVTLRCPSCRSTFQVEGVRPFEAACLSCGFRATV